jgi:outer membrane protein assembly factor BamB
MSATRKPALQPPVEIRWRVAFKSEYMGLRPVTNDQGVIVVAAHDRLFGLVADTGKILWEHAQPAHITEIQACEGGPVLALGGERVELVAYRWTGEARWRRSSDIGAGGDRLRGCGAEFLALGVPDGGQSTRQLCQVRDTDTGEVKLQFPCNGDLPDRVDGAFVYSVRGAGREGGGLFVVQPGERKPRRLLDVGHWVRVVAEGVAVVDTYDDDNRYSRLIAVELATGAVLWECPGGPNFALAVDRGQLAACVAIDDKRLAMSLRDLKTGWVQWMAEPIAAEYVSPLLADDCVIGSVISERVDLYDRVTGKLVQSLDEESSLVRGGCVATVGLIDVASPAVICFKGAGT